MTALTIEIGTALLFCIGPLYGLQEKSDTGKASSSLDLKVNLEGVTPVPEGSKVELKGLEHCTETAASTDVKSDGQAVFRTIPAACKVTIKIFIPGMDTGIVHFDAVKYRDKPVRIQMKSSGPAALID